MTVAARREREREARRGRILDAAEHIFLTKGLDLATMEDIAETAQLGKGTLYLYFKTKEDLLLGIAVRRQRELLVAYRDIAAKDEVGATQLRALMKSWTNHMSASREHLRMVMLRWASATPFENQGGEEFRDNVREIHAIVREAVHRGQTDGTVRDDIEPARLALQLWSGANGALLTQLQRHCLPEDSFIDKYAPTIDQQLDFLIDALRPQRSSQPERLLDADRVEPELSPVATPEAS